MPILNIAGPWILAVSLTSCLRIPAQTLEFPVGFKGWAIIVWSQPGYPPLQSNKDDLLLRFPADGILITSTPAPTLGAFKERVFYIDSSGVRIHTNAPPRVERFDGVESRGNQSLNHTLLFVGGNAPVDLATLGEGRRKAAELFSRLHPDAIPFQATSPGNEPRLKILPPRKTVNSLEQQNARGFIEHFIELGFLVLLVSPYIAIASFGAWWFLRAKHRTWKVLHPIRHRIYFAAYLAIVFTPSVITDFWLFMIPGPAFVGFTLLFPAILFSKSRAVILYIISLYYILPMLGGFAVFYLSLWGYSRLRRRSSRRSA